MNHPTQDRPFVVKGKIHVIYDTQDISASFRKREFVLEYADNPAYPQFLLFQFVQDRCALLEGYQVGDPVEVSFNLRGRGWTPQGGETKYFNSLEAWRINPAPVEGSGGTTSEGDRSAMAHTNVSASPEQGSIDVSNMEDEDDLPF